jgi:hypothetical protein
MEGVAHGSIKKPGLSASKAKEYVSGQSPKNLPEKTKWTDHLKKKVKEHLHKGKGK